MFYRVAVCIGLCCSVACAGEIVPATLPSGLGVDIHFTTARPGEMKMLRGAGFGMVRMDITWSRTEKQKGQYDFTAYDGLLKTMEDAGIRSMWILCYTNPLYDQNRSPYTDEGRRAFAAWATAAAKHFAGHHILWEMYNEPEGFWKPKRDDDAYVTLALAVGKAFHESAPGETLIGPAMADIDLPLLEKCCQAGLLNYWSAVTVHPYRRGVRPETVTRDYLRIRKVIEQYAPKGKHIPIFSGEWGYSTVWKGVDQETQGKFLARQWLVNTMDDVRVSIWYDWHDDGTEPKDPEHHFGTVGYAYHAGRDPVYDVKPAYRAARTMTSALDGYGFEKRLATKSEEDYVLEFSKGERIALAAWTTDPTPHDVSIEGVEGAFATYNYVGDKGAVVRSGDGGVSVELSDGPTYLIRSAE
jgi:hypothetical protein